MRKKAIIYVRGDKEEMQEMFCRLCASEKDYKVLFVTRDIEEVKGCDVLLVSSVSRISRDRKKYYEIVKKLESNFIVVESAIHSDEAMFNLRMARSIFE